MQIKITVILIFTKKLVRYLKNRHAQDLPWVLKEEHEVIKLAQYFMYTVLKDKCSQS